MAALFTGRKVRHGHHLDHHAGPAGEVLDALALAVVRVVLFKSETRVLPFLEDVLDQVLAQLGVHLTSLFLVRTGCGCNILDGIVRYFLNNIQVGV